jgi:hypothetical protein
MSDSLLGCGPERDLNKKNKKFLDGNQRER